MGWGSGYLVFNEMADKVLASNATEEVKEQILGDLIVSLQNQDWDTEMDSLQDYLHNPLVVRVFARHDIHWPYDEEGERP
jgi:hypothetical protein